jgi:hypothetical protein
MEWCDGCYRDVALTYNVVYYDRYVDLCLGCIDFFNLGGRVSVCTCGSEATKQPGHSWWCDKDGE